MSQDTTPPPDSQESPLPTREAISEAASDVQAASTELGEIITKLEEFLEVKNIGVPAWVKVKGWSNERGEYWMREIGYDLSTHTSKSLEEIPDVTYDFVATMGCGDECPFIRATVREDWQIPDPKNMPPDEFREVRDEIERRVRVRLSTLI